MCNSGRSNPAYAALALARTQSAAVPGSSRWSFCQHTTPGRKYSLEAPQCDAISCLPFQGNDRFWRIVLKNSALPSDLNFSRPCAHLSEEHARGHIVDCLCSVELLQAIYDGLERPLSFTPLSMLVFVTT
jgi:hypothetical protein